jgi:hypothetical protein
MREWSSRMRFQKSRNDPGSLEEGVARQDPRSWRDAGHLRLIKRVRNWVYGGPEVGLLILQNSKTIRLPVHPSF